MLNPCTTDFLKWFCRPGEDVTKPLSNASKKRIDTLLSNLVLVCKTERQPGQMWFDTGCRRCVSGPEDHQKMQDKLASIGLQPLRINKQEEFVFGNAKTSTSDCSFLYPAFLKGRFVGLIDIARVPVQCPALFSLKMAKKWGCLTDHKNGQLIVKDHICTYDFQSNKRPAFTCIFAT